MSAGDPQPHALLLDLDGVLYQGDAVIPGAVRVAAWLASEGIPHLYLTNTTSRPRAALVTKLAAMGIAVDESRILTPPVAASAWLLSQGAGCIAAFVPQTTLAEFSGFRIAPPDAEDGVDAVVVGDLGEDWDFRRLNRAFRLLMSDPRPRLVALGMTRYWKADDGLRLDTAPFVMALAHASGAEPVVLGKPAAPFFETALERLDVDAGHCTMIGDDLRVDVGGAQACGIRGILVRTGKFHGEESADGIEPSAVLDSITELPERWAALCGHEH